MASGGTPTANEYPINLGALSSPLVVTAGNTVILALLDQGSFEWTVVGGTAVTGTGVSSIGVTTANGVSGTSSGGSTPSLTLALGAITPSSVIASGIVDGQAPVTITTGSTATLGGTYSSGYTINHEGTAATAVTYTLPTAAAGKQYCVKNGNNGSAADTGVLTLQTSAAGQSIVYNGTAGASDGYLVSGGAAGDAACVVGISYNTLGGVCASWKLGGPLMRTLLAILLLSLSADGQIMQQVIATHAPGSAMRSADHDVSLDAHIGMQHEHAMRNRSSGRKQRLADC